MRSNLIAFIALLMAISGTNLNAQSITWGTGSANDLQVLFDSTSVTYEFTNSSLALSNASFQVQLVNGIEYVAGDLSFTSSGSASVTESSSTGANLAIFSIGTLAANEILTITFPRRADCQARAHKVSGGIFQDVAHIYENGTEVTYLNNGAAPYGVVYDLTYGNIVLSTPTHLPSSSVSVGSTVSRSIIITNGSFGSIDKFWFQDDFDNINTALSNFEINGTAIAAGKISIVGGIATISFDASNITEINGSGGTNGDADIYFEKDEYFTLSYDIALLDCGTVPSGNFVPLTISFKSMLKGNFLLSRLLGLL